MVEIAAIWSVAGVRARALRSLVPPRGFARLPEGVSALPGPVRLWLSSTGLRNACGAWSRTGADQSRRGEGGACDAHTQVALGRGKTFPTYPPSKVLLGHYGRVGSRGRALPG
jgi:hypothetical protein